MKREQTITQLQLCIMQCTDAYLAFIDCLYSREPLSSVATLLSKYLGRKFLAIQLWYAPTQDHTQLFGYARLRKLMFLGIIFVLFMSLTILP